MSLQRRINAAGRPGAAARDIRAAVYSYFLPISAYTFCFASAIFSTS